MATRAANATIKGYYYQFDTSILKLLELKSDTDSITVEGLEDIDINTPFRAEAVQCKYLSKPKFINSAVREPIMLMLDHFCDPATSNTVNYILYAHFEDETPGNEPVIDLVRLKTILTYTENKVERHHEVEKGISDTSLIKFLSQFKFVFGKEFSVQQLEVIRKFKAHFKCSEFQADTLYYNNALRLIIEKASKADGNQRIITRAEFISGIDCSKKLFNEWYIELRSKKKYLTLCADTLKSTGSLSPSKTRIVLVGKDILMADNSQLPAHSFVENLISKYYKLGSSLRTAKPLTFVFDCSSNTLTGIKKLLIQEDVLFNDGFEEINFSSSHFNREPIVNLTPNGSKISKSSYTIRLISRACFIDNISTITPPSVFFNFSKDDLPNNFTVNQIFDFKYCEDLMDIYNVLTS